MRFAHHTFLLFAAVFCASCATAPLDSSINYSTYEQALAAVRSDSRMKLVEDGYYMFHFSNRSSSETWFFTKPTHYAHPSVVKQIQFVVDQAKMRKRGLTYKAYAVEIETETLCAARPAICTRLDADLEEQKALYLRGPR